MWMQIVPTAILAANLVVADYAPQPPPAPYVPKTTSSIPPISASNSLRSVAAITTVVSVAARTTGIKPVQSKYVAPLPPSIQSIASRTKDAAYNPPKASSSVAAQATGLYVPPAPKCYDPTPAATPKVNNLVSTPAAYIATTTLISTPAAHTGTMAPPATTKSMPLFTATTQDAYVPSYDPTIKAAANTIYDIKASAAHKNLMGVIVLLAAYLVL
ncbi:hypothetical protein BC830DRAFT_1108748 [Chytriomyces sp. MP71]|nr:hypothetical protein BC830DRAFT_1108748 [Chytriomyces sp. MP71]